MGLAEKVTRVKVYKSLSDSGAYYAIESNGQPGYYSQSISDLVLTAGSLLSRAELDFSSTGMHAQGHIQVKILDDKEVSVLKKSIKEYEKGISSIKPSYNGNSYKKLI